MILDISNSLPPGVGRSLSGTIPYLLCCSFGLPVHGSCLLIVLLLKSRDKLLLPLLDDSLASSLLPSLLSLQEVRASQNPSHGGPLEWGLLSVESYRELTSFLELSRRA